MQTRTVTLQAFNPTTGQWETRNAFTTENRQLSALILERRYREADEKADDIRANATCVMNQWHATAADGRQLRVYDSGRDPLRELKAASLGAAATPMRQSSRPHPLYLAEVNLGRLGRVFIETDRDRNSREFVVGLIRTGEIDPVKVIEIDEEAGSVRDVTDELVDEAMQARAA